MDIRIIKIIRDTDFSILNDNDENYNIIKFDDKHGTVYYVAGLIEDDEDALMCVGCVDGEKETRIAFHDGFKDFKEGWDKLLGRNQSTEFPTEPPFNYDGEMPVE